MIGYISSEKVLKRMGSVSPTANAEQCSLKMVNGANGEQGDLTG